MGGMKAMEQWREVAINMLPELRSEAGEAESPMSFWLEVVYKFDDAYEFPRNEDFIKRVYAYADWCLKQEGGGSAPEHLPTCVVICFWEHIPTCKAAREDMPRWFSFDEVIANEHFFKYSITEEEFEELKGLYVKV
jgi:hypothetical protein